MKKLKIIIFISLLSLQISCATIAAKQDLVLKRAKFDFSCSIQDMKVTEINSGTFGVEGCNKKAVYIVDCPSNLILVIVDQF